MLKSVTAQPEPFATERYLFEIMDKTLVYMSPLFQPQNPLLDPRLATTLEAVHRKMHEVAPQDTDLRHLIFYNQGSFPYSDEVEKVMNLLSMKNRIVIQGDSVILTPKGETDLQRLRKEYLS